MTARPLPTPLRITRSPAERATPLTSTQQALINEAYTVAADKLTLMLHMVAEQNLADEPYEYSLLAATLLQRAERDPDLAGGFVGVLALALIRLRAVTS